MGLSVDEISCFYKTLTLPKILTLASCIDDQMDEWMAKWMADWINGWIAG